MAKPSMGMETRTLATKACTKRAIDRCCDGMFWHWMIDRYDSSIADVHLRIRAIQNGPIQRTLLIVGRRMGLNIWY